MPAYDTTACANAVIAELKERFEGVSQAKWDIAFNYIKAGLDACASEVWKEAYEAGQRSVEDAVRSKLQAIKLAVLEMG